MWKALIELHWDRPLPLFFVGISLWIGAALSLDLVHSKEFHIWKALLGLTTLFALALPHFTISLVCVGFAALLGWLLAVRFFHYFQSWWIIVLGYALVRIHPVLLPHITSTVCLSLGLVAWVYGAFKAVSERSMRNVWGMSGVLLRPYDDRPDDDFPTDDLWTYQKIGEKGTEITSYPNVSVFHEFKYHPKQAIAGGFDTWTYDHVGVFSWTVEFWSLMRQAGIEKFKFIEWYLEHPVEDDFKMLKWNDDVLKGKGFVNWYAYKHLQLGKVELGGWDSMNMCTNPPLEFLEKEISPFPDWIVWHALISPELALRETKVFRVCIGISRQCKGGTGNDGLTSLPH